MISPKPFISSKPFIIYNKGIVDGDEWFSLRVKSDVYNWVIEQDKSLWADPGYHHLVDVHSELLLVMKLRFL